MKKQQRSRSQGYHRLPPGRDADAQGQAAAIDCVYFQAHPRARTYIQRRLPGEFGAADDDPAYVAYTLVAVTQVGEGCCLRRALTPDGVCDAARQVGGGPGIGAGGEGAEGGGE